MILFPLWKIKVKDIFLGNQRKTRRSRLLKVAFLFWKGREELLRDQLRVASRKASNWVSLVRERATQEGEVRKIALRLKLLETKRVVLLRQITDSETLCLVVTSKCFWYLLVLLVLRLYIYYFFFRMFL